MQKKRRKTFSEAFKKEKVQLMESGQIRKIEIIKMYGVSYTTLYKWLKKYGNYQPSDAIVIEKDSEYQKNKILRTQIRKMERVIGRQQMELDYYKEVLKQASVHLEIDIEKKFSSK